MNRFLFEIIYYDHYADICNNTKMSERLNLMCNHKIHHIWVKITLYEHKKHCCLCTFIPDEMMTNCETYC